MKVTILTVVYNNVATIEFAIRSMLCQTYENKEFIIIDGGSTDGTLQKIDLYKDDLDIVISEPDKGIYDAMNKGLSLATGDIICILNSDDIYTDQFVIEKVVNKFKNTESDCVYGDLDIVDAMDTSKIIRHWISGEYKVNSFLFGWMPPHPSFFVKRHIYEKYGKFNIKLRNSADYELMLRFIHKNNILTSYLPEVLVKMRSGGISNSSFRNRIKANKEDRIAWTLNEIKPYFFTLILKPLRKLKQFK